MNAPCTPTRRPARRPHSKVRRASRTRQAQTRDLTEQVMSTGELAAAAAAVTQATLTDAELQAWRHDLETRLATVLQRPEQGLGFIEEHLALAAREPLRLLAERAAQAKANLSPATCRQCQGELASRKYLPRTIASRFGPLRFFRPYGWCAQCEAWDFPSDYALGLARNAPASPYVQEICGLLVSKMPCEQAVDVAARLGLQLSRCVLHREAHRQGLKAEAARADALAQLDTWEELKQVVCGTDGPSTQPFTLIIEIDAWNIRERDQWGQTQTLRDRGEKLERWHWVYMGTVFRLDHRGQTAGDRAVISQRGYVATRQGIDALMGQLYREALARGCSQAKEVLVIADGAIWIWNAAHDRFPDARQRLDLYHADEHLWAVAHDLFGKGTPEAKRWVAPLLQQIRADQTTAVIQTLGELAPTLDRSLGEKVQTQIEYFKNNAHRMRYREILQARQAVEKGIATPAQRDKANEPMGSGAIESTCRQYQCRFKRTGQFWSLVGDEALMCLETFWRNGRWHQLYPHATVASPSRN